MKPRPSIPRLSKKKAAEQEGRKVYSTISKRSRVKPKKRSAKSAERIYGPKAFRDWLHQQPCAVSGVRGSIVQAHAKGGGMARKADWTFTFPLADELHRQSHRVGVQTFEAKHGVSLLDLAAETQSRWRAQSGESA